MVGCRPDGPATFTPVNLSDAGPTDGGSAAVGERFAERPSSTRRAHPQVLPARIRDNYDQLVIWTDAPLIQDAFAYETTVRTRSAASALTCTIVAADFGSAGRLRSMVGDGLARQVSRRPDAEVPRREQHAERAGPGGRPSLAGISRLPGSHRPAIQALLGRDVAHWSFFFDSDASVMEGNDIEDLGGGSFRTVGAVSATACSISTRWASSREARCRRSSTSRTRRTCPAPGRASRRREIGVTFNGTRREVLVQDIVAIHGPREPSAADSARVHRQAFIYLVSSGRTADAGQVVKAG